MKTSNKLMLGALVVILVSLVVSNFGLRAEYLSGEYKNPFSGYAQKSIEGFNEIEVDAINMMHVTIQQGNYAVHLSGTNTDSIKLTHAGNRLIVDVDFVKKAMSDDPNVPHMNDIIISCPQLIYIKTEEHHYSIARRKLTGEDAFEVTRGGRSVNLEDFRLDSLNIDQKTGAVNIRNSKIASLKAVTDARSRLSISDDTHIDKADLHINDYTHLTFEKFNIRKFNYTLADSATITFTSKGNFFKELMK